MKIYEELARIQKVLKAPKSQFNNFGKYSYRSCEDVLEAVKEVTNCAVTLTDEIVVIDVNIYVKAVATLINSEGESTSTTAFAREPITKKGMDPSQITGAASSYARKYALNGLFAIDDNKDAETVDNSTNNNTEKPKKEKKLAENTEKPWYNDIKKHQDLMTKDIVSGEKTAKQIIESLENTYKVSPAVKSQINLIGE